MRQGVIKVLRPLDAISVENPAYPGTPDVNYMEGWIELKWARNWPVREETFFQLDHFTPQQRVWLKRRWKKGGESYLLLQVKKEWLLFDGLTAATHVGKCNRVALINHSIKYWNKGLDKLDFLNFLVVGRSKTIDK